MGELFWRLKAFVTRDDRKILCAIFLSMMIGAGLEVVGVGIILPFIALLGDEQVLQKNQTLNEVYTWLAPESFREFVLYAIFSLIVFFVFKNAYSYASIVMQNRFFKKLHYAFARRLFRSYLLSPYSISVGRNSAQQIRNLTIVGSVIQGLILPLMILFTDLFVTIAIFTLVIWTSPERSLFVGFALIFTIGIFYILVRRKLATLGQVANFHHGRMMQTLQQGLGSIKETKILGRESFFSKEYEKDLNALLETARVQNQFSQLPRFYIETVVVSLLLGLLAWMFSLEKNPQTIIASISIFAVAAIRLMPGFARISAAMNSIRFYTPSLREVYNDLLQSEKVSELPSDSNVVPFKFQKEIQFQNIRYRYLGTNEDTLKGINLRILKNSLIGFAGASGAGKTTLIDILLGLLTPGSGQILVDGVDIQSNLRGWQKQFGYIPQQIYLSDESIRKNVGFGLEESDIEDQKVWKALELAQLSDFVRTLPEGLDTKVGERGTRLSGGQRQRIGIARALYHEPEILILDEATAALDNKTEQMFMEAIFGLAGQKTMIFIAHRLTTLERCDTIYNLSDGKILESGTYHQLFAGREAVREMQ